MNFKWYIVHTYSGFEEKVKSLLEQRIKSADGMEQYFKEILIPTEKVLELIKGERVTSSRKFYPGYILIHCLDLHIDEEKDDEETKRLKKAIWHLVRRTPKVTGFVGGQDPLPIPQEEVEKIKERMEEGEKRPKPKFIFRKGDHIKIVDGPFTNFTGRIDEIFPERGKVRVLISIFGRETPVELDAIQLSKI
ncbi:MAG: transcription termination/antitermination protein NusG [Deltaproteobacteria bacterium]|nr:transcription termination/antitermination protein NusG [Deltaproteobacteria bacterium]